MYMKNSLKFLKNAFVGAEIWLSVGNTIDLGDYFGSGARSVSLRIRGRANQLTRREIDQKFKTEHVGLIQTVPNVHER